MMNIESQNMEFKESGEIEAWGRGIERIITVCKNEGFSTPEFRYDASGIWTIFRFEYPERATTQETTQEKTIRKTELQKAIIEYLRGNPSATRKELTESIPNSTVDGIKYNLGKLQKAGILKRVGSTKSGHWQVLTDLKEECDRNK